MKTTLDLPDALVRQLKLRAVHDGRKLKEVAADLLRKGLEAASVSSSAPVVVKDRKTRLPVIQCRRAAPRGQELTPERVAQILVEQEAGWARDSG
ncbi:antitoxin [Candidatus Sumerlaeota bacterium]|nr:antitoxin [Candidatus Sumerlaeota bacterium]